MQNVHMKYMKISTIQNWQVTGAKSKSGTVIIHQRVLVVYETTSKVKWCFESGTVPLYCSLVTSL